MFFKIGVLMYFAILIGKHVCWSLQVQLNKKHKTQKQTPTNMFSSLHNSLKLSFANIQGLSNFVDCKSFLESNSPDILALCETNLHDSTDSGNFSGTFPLPLIRKDSGTHIHGLAVYVKEGLPFARNLFLENSADSYLCCQLVLLHSLS